MSDKSIKLDCECIGRCSVLCVDFDKYGTDERTWSWDFYTNSGYVTGWRHRLRIIWNLLRGQEHYFHGTVHTAEDMLRLRAFLDETLPAAASPHGLTVTHTTGGAPIVYRPSGGTL